MATQACLARPAEVDASALIGCLLAKRQATGVLLWACLWKRRRIPRRSRPAMATAAALPAMKPWLVNLGIGMCM